MSTVSKLDEIEGIFFEDLADDYEGVWTLARMVRDALGSSEASPGLVREVTLRLAKGWLAAGLVRVGVPCGYDRGFDAWPEEGEAAAQRLAAEWDDTSRLPTLGEVAWFDLTPGEAGERRVA